jgi:4-aminobutyrate aminotransferase-like enzyme
VLDVIEGEGLQQNAVQLGRHIVAGLASLADQHEVIGDVRGNGLFIAVELVSDRAARSPATEITARVVNDLRERGVLTGSIGPDNNVLKLRPPMVLREAEADLMLETLDASLRAVTA